MTTSSEIYCGKDLRFNNESEDITFNYKDDFSTISYYDNLNQAIINRLKTAQGELSLHPNYGSKLNSLIGKGSTGLLLTEAKQYVRAALLQEPRINTINSISTKYKDYSNRQTIEISINITPIGNSAEPLNLTWDYFLTYRFSCLFLHYGNIRHCLYSQNSWAQHKANYYLQVQACKPAID